MLIVRVPAGSEREMKTRMAFLLTALALTAWAIALADDPEVRVDASTYKPGDMIRVSFSAPADYPENAWIGLIPSDVDHGDEDENDRHDVAHEYLSGRTSGSIRFKAPKKAGEWDVRLNDGKGSEVASASFRVEAPAE